MRQNYGEKAKDFKLKDITKA